MARYIDVEGYRKLFDEEYKKTRELIFEGETHLDNLAEGFSEASRVIDKIPTADVAPKSEVAREIFEEIDKILKEHTTEQHYRGERFIPKTIDIGIERAIRELKKKYVECEDD